MSDPTVTVWRVWRTIRLALSRSLIVQLPAASGEHVTGALIEVASLLAVPTKLSAIVWDGIASKPLVAEALPPSPETVT